MSWRVARSLDKLLAQINAAYPNRSKRSDGSIGDAAHASRSSDHNPWIRYGGVGVVSARDFTHDPANGFNSYTFADRLRRECAAGRESRVKYIISNGRIASGTRNAWAWRRYTGANPHSSHVHVSVSSTRSRYDDASAWSQALFGGASTPTPQPKPKEWDEMATKKEVQDAVRDVVKQEMSRQRDSYVNATRLAILKQPTNVDGFTHRVSLHEVLARAHN
ncbi:MAG TPA: hypothetical protein VK095_00175, partial [Beutenbergiaceae bacterium]|nr:hypothetical protein [Beutenbergiaceae bacterium]